MTFGQAFIILAVCAFLCGVCYEIGWRRGVNASWTKAHETKEELLHSAYAKGRQDADNWWIRREEEAESVK